MTKRNDGTQAHKQFKLLGGTDEARIQIVQRIHKQYGEIIAEEVKIDPAIEAEAAQNGISICWVHHQRFQVAKGPWTGTKGAVASC